LLKDISIIKLIASCGQLIKSKENMMLILRKMENALRINEEKGKCI